MAARSNDWYTQAGRDLSQAEESKLGGRHEWACFAAQQAAEKAVKALHLAVGQEAWGHVIARLLSELPEALRPGADLVNKARVLDGFYIPSRYPDSYPEGAPFEHFGEIQSEQAVKYAGEIIAFVGDCLAKTS